MLLGEIVHAGAGREVGCVLHAAVEHDDERHAVAGVAGGNVEVVAARPGGLAVGEVADLATGGGGSDRGCARTRRRCASGQPSRVDDVRQVGQLGLNSVEKTVECRCGMGARRFWMAVGAVVWQRRAKAAETDERLRNGRFRRRDGVSPAETTPQESRALRQPSGTCEPQRLGHRGVRNVVHRMSFQGVAG